MKTIQRLSEFGDDTDGRQVRNHDVKYLCGDTSLDWTEGGG